MAEAISISDNPRKVVRLAAFIVDCVGYWFFIVFLSIVVAFVFRGLFVLTLHEVPYFIILSVTVFLYYFIFEFFWGKTPGKFILGLKVVGLKGQRPSKVQIGIRSICRGIPFESVGVIFNHCPHDFLSKTQVVKSKTVISS
jgi:uncharacterized RDD family membrane protein YckC